MPVLAAYAGAILRLAEEVGPEDCLVGSSRVPVSDSLQTIATAHDPIAPSVRRLRTTFIVTLLQANVPFRLIMTAAGLETPRRLAEYSRYLPDVCPDEALRLIVEAGQ